MLQSKLRCQMRSSSGHLTHQARSQPWRWTSNNPVMEGHSLIHSRCYAPVYHVGVRLFTLGPRLRDGKDSRL